MNKSNRKRAFITGVMGQDGSYLAELLVGKGYKVFGMSRTLNHEMMKHLDDVEIIVGDMGVDGDIENAIATALPDEVYNLAAISDLRTAIEFPELTMKINYHAVGRLVDSAVNVNPKVKVLQASSSEMFEKVLPLLDENTKLKSQNIYAEAKIKAHQEYIVEYRKNRGMFACSAFLFNHESPRRDLRFVTRKITNAMVRISKGSQEVLELGNLDAERDWGFAGDYVKAMWLMLQQEKPSDFVIASGQNHKVSEFVDEAASQLGIKIVWRGEGIRKAGYKENGELLVRVNNDFYRPSEPMSTKGNIDRVRKQLGWIPEVSFSDLVKLMIKEDLDVLSRA